MPMLAQHWMLAWKLSDFSGDPDQYCYETLYFVIFKEGGGPNPLPPPSESVHTDDKKCLT